MNSYLVLLQRRLHLKRIYRAILLAVLIAVVLFQTQWPNLRAGLIVLLAGQLGDVLALCVRNVQLSKGIALEDEELFIKRLARFDTACQMIGFLALGYAFWIYTHGLLLAIVIGLVYPVTTYFGITRRNTIAAIKRLRSEKTAL